MNDATTAPLLQELVRRESRSLFQYVREVPVWVGASDRPALQKLRAIAAAELEAIDALGRHLQKRRIGLATLGPFPPEFTDVNNAALHHLLPKLVREQKEVAADVEAGQMLGYALFEAIQATPDYQADIAEARREVAAARALGRTNPGCAAERLALAD